MTQQPAPRPPLRPPLKVGINLLWLVPGVVGGSEAYATGLLRRLADRTDIEPTVYALPGYATKYPELSSAIPTVLAPIKPGRHVLRRVMIENGWLPRRMRDARIDIAHHLGGLIPARCHIPAAVTLHDLQYLAYPEYFSSAKRRYLAASQGRSLRDARVVMAISEFTRTQAIDHFDLPANKVVVVPPVVASPSPPSQQARREIRHTFELDGDFVLYPAATYPHKNHLVLVRAFADVARDRDTVLVLTGATGAGAWGSAHSTHDQIVALAEELGISARVRMLGYVTDEQLRALYAEASMLAFPSRFEGFGLPVLEAMVAGCPVVVADATALPALVGDAGILVDPDDADAWAKAITQLLDDETQRARLAKAGQHRAADLANHDPLEALIAGYRQAALP